MLVPAWFFYLGSITWNSPSVELTINSRYIFIKIFYCIFLNKLYYKYSKTRMFLCSMTKFSREAIKQSLSESTRCFISCLIWLRFDGTIMC